MRYDHMTIAALDLIGLELFREKEPESLRDQITGTLSYRQFRQQFPDADVDLSGNPDQFLASGTVLYRCDQNDHGGYTVKKAAREEIYSALYLQLSRDEDCPQYMTVGFTNLPGYEWENDKNTINLLDVPEEKVAAILAAHPEVPVYPEPIQQNNKTAPAHHPHRKLFRFF